jgi:hypothetical protein
MDVCHAVISPRSRRRKSRQRLRASNLVDRQRRLKASISHWMPLGMPKPHHTPRSTAGVADALFVRPTLSAAHLSHGDSTLAPRMSPRYRYRPVTPVRGAHALAVELEHSVEVDRKVSTSCATTWSGCGGTAEGASWSRPTTAPSSLRATSPRHGATPPAEVVVPALRACAAPWSGRLYGTRTPLTSGGGLPT